MFRIAHFSRRLTLLALLLASSGLRAQPAPDAPPPKPPPGADIVKGDTIQLHRVVYVHQSAVNDDNLLQKRHFVDQYAAPPSLFDPGADAMPSIAAPPVIQVSPAMLQHQREQADRQKNWMLMTPEEILGLDNHNQKKDDPYDTDHYLSIEDRYLRRSMMHDARTNQTDEDSILKKRDFLNPDGIGNDPVRDRNSPNYNHWTDGGLKGLMTGDRSATDASDRWNQAPNAWATSIWGQSPAEDPTQAKLKYQQDMQQFSQMVSPSSHPTTETKVSSLGNPFAPAGANPLQLQQQARPHDAASTAETFSNLRDKIGHPVMPSLYAAPVVPEHRRKPSPPPWTRNAGQLGLGQ